MDTIRDTPPMQLVRQTSLGGEKATASLVTQVTIAYIAGLFDGEGSAGTSMVKATKNGKRYKRLRTKITQTDRIVLDWVVQQLGYGRIYPKRDKRALARGWKEAYDFVVTHKLARKFLTIIEPYLIVKRENVSKLLDEHGREATRPIFN